MTTARIGTLIAAAMALEACCCRPSVETQLRAAERENQALRFRIDATAQAAQAARDYTAELGGSAPPRPTFAMLYAANDLTLLSRGVLPYRIPAREFDSRLAGDIVVERMDSVIFQPGNRLTCRLYLKGAGVRFTGQVPGFAQKRVDSFLDGIAAGVVTDLDVDLAFDASGTVRALARATHAKLLRNSNAGDERQLVEQMNEKALKNPLRFDVDIQGTPAKLARLTVTGNHLVVSYTP